MKIYCVIDSLGSGGAQRQLVSLAVELKKKGNDIRFLVYHEYDHFMPLLKEANISCEVVKGKSAIKRAMSIRKILRSGWQDVVIAYLEGASFFAEVSNVPKQKWGLVVSERLANHSIRTGFGSFIRQFHRFADVIVCNSHTNKMILYDAYPFLLRKLCTIYNVVDMGVFSDKRYNVKNDSKKPGVFRIVVAARYEQQKNMMNVAMAISIVKKKVDQPAVVLDWYGSMDKKSVLFEDVMSYLERNDLSSSIIFHDSTLNIANEYAVADVIGLFSLYEGLPNTICEGMAMGKPIILSNVCDASNLVVNNKNGYLCDPKSPEDIAEKIIKLMMLSDVEKDEMGRQSRLMAEKLFSKEIVIDKYERILLSLKNHCGTIDLFDWPSEEPESARKFIHDYNRG